MQWKSAVSVQTTVAEDEISTSWRLPLLCLSLLQGNKGKTGVIIAAYMHYSKISAGWVFALETPESHSLTFSCE